MKSPKHQILKAIGICSLANVLFMTPIHAATYTWNGGSVSNSNWSTGANWGGSAPPVDANHILAFGGSTRLTPSNDFAAGSSFNSIVFNSGAGAFTLSGNATSLGGAGPIIRNDGATAQTVGLAVTVTTDGAQLSGVGKIVIGSGGSVSFGANRFYIGTAGTSANVELSNGGSLTSTYNSTGYSYIGLATAAAANNSATLTVKAGGSLDSSSAVALGASQNEINTGVSGTLNVSGGIVDVKDSKGILFGGPFAVGSSVDGGTINLDSGTLRVAKITKKQSTTNAAFNFSGGTLAAYDSNNLVVGSATAANNFAVTLTGSGGIVSSSDKVGTGRTVDIYSAIGQDTGGRGLTFSGNGTTTLRAANTYTGNTTISAGTLSANAANALGGTARVTVNSGGTLLLSSNAPGLVKDTAAVVLNGGKVQIANTVSGLQETMGALTLGGNSTIDFGTGGTLANFNRLTLGQVTSWTPGAILNIWNWTGTPRTAGGTDRLLVSDQTNWSANNLSKINFFSDSGSTLIGGGGAMFVGLEIVAVPEPSTWVAMAALVLTGGIMAMRRRHRKAMETNFM